MNTLTRRGNPVADMLGWLDHEAGTNLLGLGLTPYVRVEDFVEDDVYVLRAEMPGIDPDKDVEITMSDHRLHLRAERRSETQTDDKKAD